MKETSETKVDPTQFGYISGGGTTSSITVKPAYEVGYHTRKIEKGVFGEASKIREECEEFMDAVEQHNPVMAIQELSDMIGAIKAYAKKYNFTLADLMRMTDATERAFKVGDRK